MLLQGCNRVMAVLRYGNLQLSCSVCTLGTGNSEESDYFLHYRQAVFQNRPHPNSFYVFPNSAHVYPVISYPMLQNS
jgi:hypothetical protein